MINFQLHLFNGENISCANQKKRNEKYRGGKGLYQSIIFGIRERLCVMMLMEYLEFCTIFSHNTYTININTAMGIHGSY